MVNSDGVTAPLPLTCLPNITTASSTPPGGKIFLWLISPGNLTCVDLALGGWSSRGRKGGSCAFLNGMDMLVTPFRERSLIWYSWHCPRLSRPSPSWLPGPQEPRMTCWRAVICFCPINFYKGQEQITGLEGWPGKNTDEELAA